MYTSFTDWESGLYLQHHGIRGMKWGQRRWQNEDGSLTEAGRQHYGVSDGGNRKMERLYKRQMKRLNKLQSRADVDQQRANVQKYNKRAKIAAGIGLGAAGIAGGTRVRNVLEKKRVQNFISGKNDEWDRNFSNLEQNVRDLWKNDKQAYDSAGKWTGKGYSKATSNAIDKVMASGNSKLDSIDREISTAKSAFNRMANIRKAVTYGAAGVAAVSAGVAVYNKVQAHMAKTRMTDAGHQKAVQNVKRQMAKMEKMFADTPYSQLVSQQQNTNQKQKKK